MIIRFWGVRGSCPTPVAPEELRRKIASVVQRIRSEDILNTDRRQAFLAKLPPELFGTVGGNTDCLEIRTVENSMVIFDTGTGLRELEKRVKRHREEIREYHIFMSHFHYDHLLGLPYFGALYDPRNHVTFYSPYPAMERIMTKFMSKPYHPVGWDSFAAATEFRILSKGERVEIGGAAIDWIRRNHPDGSISYKISESGRSFIYSTDTELTDKDFRRTRANLDYFKGADALVLDAQYTLGEAIEKYNWGHSSYSLAVEFAREFDIASLYLFHHEPLNDDAEMEGILRSARWYDSRLDTRKGRAVTIDLAREGSEIEL